MSFFFFIFKLDINHGGVEKKKKKKERLEKHRENEK
jgi:hypothetical protein